MSSRDFVESYVKNKDAETTSYLADQQPSFDAQGQRSTPNLPSSGSSALPLPDEPAPEAPTSTFSFHRTTSNPIPATPQIPEPASQEKMPMEPQYAVRSYGDQRQHIHDTAQTNCADLHADLLQCFQHGSWWDKAKMCEDQKQQFWACFHSQKEFLKKANYKNPFSTPEEDERILLEALRLPNKQKEAKTSA
ncbi:hypothetical protein DM01DRAFT_1332405 [Hesseltinella vesiculosa]|uniref:Uncharacterized protein n=1 Tax=Hesseltinella vesiculosa TaxID=101127 RepID=A0A1X2GRY4_9FUNG|nr:hypothetical protein DM01DRAFT_1332405 [Hesseltinella vesiculosa]